MTYPKKQDEQEKILYSFDRCESSLGTIQSTQPGIPCKVHILALPRRFSIVVLPLGGSALRN